MKDKFLRFITKTVCVTVAGMLFASFTPSQAQKAIVVEDGIFPQGLFARTEGYLPGDTITVTNLSGNKTVEVLCIGSLENSKTDGAAILLSPEAAGELGLSSSNNALVQLSKRPAKEDSTNGTAIIVQTVDFTVDDENLSEISENSVLPKLQTVVSENTESTQSGSDDSEIQDNSNNSEEQISVEQNDEIQSLENLTENTESFEELKFRDDNKGDDSIISSELEKMLLAGDEETKEVIEGADVYENIAEVQPESADVYESVAELYDSESTDEKPYEIITANEAENLQTTVDESLNKPNIQTYELNEEPEEEIFEPEEIEEITEEKSAETEIFTEPENQIVEEEIPELAEPQSVEEIVEEVPVETEILNESENLEESQDENQIVEEEFIPDDELPEITEENVISVPMTSLQSVTDDASTVVEKSPVDNESAKSAQTSEENEPDEKVYIEEYILGQELEDLEKADTSEEVTEESGIETAESSENATENTEITSENPETAESEIITEEADEITESEIVTEEPNETSETEVVTEEPNETSETEVVTEEPNETSETEVVTEEPNETSETEVVTEEPNETSETEVVTEEPNETSETEVVTEELAETPETTEELNDTSKIAGTPLEEIEIPEADEEDEYEAIILVPVPETMNVVTAQKIETPEENSSETIEQNESAESTDVAESALTEDEDEEVEVVLEKIEESTESIEAEESSPSVEPINSTANVISAENTTNDTTIPKIAASVVQESTVAPSVSSPSENAQTATSALSEQGLPYQKYMKESLSELDSAKYYIQIAALSKDENIMAIVSKYGQNYPLTLVPSANGKTKLILVGPVSLDEYKVVLERFKSYGFKDAFLKKLK